MDQSSFDTKLLYSVDNLNNSDDLDKVRTLLQKGANPNYLDLTFDRQAIPVLTRLIVYNDFNKVTSACAELFIQYGADIELQNKPYVGTAMESAYDEDKVEWVHFLMDHGADPNNSMLTALYMKRQKIIDVLFNSDKLNVNYTNYGYTFLTYTTYNNDLVNTQRLLELGADPYCDNEFNKYGVEKPLDIAIRKKYHDLKDLLLKFTQN